MLLDFVKQNILRSLTGEGEPIWTCSLCSHSSQNKSNLIRHFEAKHIISSGFPCNVCDKILPSKNARQTHMYRFHKY